MFGTGVWWAEADPEAGGCGVCVCRTQNLGSSDVHRSVKPAILTCIGDIARALGAQFESCLQVGNTKPQQQLQG